MTSLWNRFAPLRSRGIPASSSSAGIPLVFLGAGVVAVVDSVNEPIGVFDADAVLHFVRSSSSRATADDDAALEAGVASTSSAATALDNHAQGLLDGAAGESSLDFRLSMPSFSSSLLTTFD